jgi:probable phosphoglycerate mutase
LPTAVSEPNPPIWLVRHGLTDWNRERRIQGQIDTVLNAAGHLQSEALARGLRKVLQPVQQLRYFVSPLTRARQTMGYISSSFGVDASSIEVEPLLKELGFGVWEGRLVRELKTHADYPRDPGERFRWRPLNGESYADGIDRVSRWLAGLDGPTIVVSHGAIGRCIIGLVAGLEAEQLVLTAMPQGRFCRLMNGRIDWFDESGAAA